MPGQYKRSTHPPGNHRSFVDALPATCISVFVEDLSPLLSRTLVLVAHPDDEAVGCGALLQRMAEPIVVYGTDGAPRSDYFWQTYKSREEYARARQKEAENALHSADVERFRFLCEPDPIADQELFTSLECAWLALAELVKAERPDAILTMAYEGGHPDHDACCFLVSMAAKEFGVACWEMPLYHRREGTIERQRFLAGEGIKLEIALEELVEKMSMFAAYESQAEVLWEFFPYLESFRPLADYDFSRPPHEGVLNYEAWGWPMKGADLCRAFTEISNRLTNKKQWGTAA